MNFCFLTNVTGLVFFSATYHGPTQRASNYRRRQDNRFGLITVGLAPGVLQAQSTRQPKSMAIVEEMPRLSLPGIFNALATDYRHIYLTSP